MGEEDDWLERTCGDKDFTECVQTESEQGPSWVAVCFDGNGIQACPTDAGFHRQCLSLSRTLSGWRVTAHQAMLLRDEGTCRLIWRMVVGLIRSRAYTTAVRDGGVADRKRQIGQDTPVPTAGWRCSSRGSAGAFPTEPLAGHH